MRNGIPFTAVKVTASRKNRSRNCYINGPAPKQELPRFVPREENVAQKQRENSVSTKLVCAHLGFLARTQPWYIKKNHVTLHKISYLLFVHFFYSLFYSSCIVTCEIVHVLHVPTELLEII